MSIIYLRGVSFSGLLLHRSFAREVKLPNIRNSKDETKTQSETKVLLCNHIYFRTSCPMISLRKLRLVLITIFSTVVDLGGL